MDEQVDFIIFFVIFLSLSFSVLFDVLFVLATFLFHNGWVGKLKEDWRFPETEPQGGDEKALSNNSNSHQTFLSLFRVAKCHK